jgi:hypothetical protein
MDHSVSEPLPEKQSLTEATPPKDFKEVNLQGNATNVTSNQGGGLVMQVTYKKGQLWAKGTYDSLHLFGRFDVKGRILPYCVGKGALCLQFIGELLLGNDGSGFPKDLRANYEMSLVLTSEGGQGTYRISGLSPYFDYDQFGILQLQPTAKPDPELKKLKFETKRVSDTSPNP